jgi:hypothetical protein
VKADLFGLTVLGEEEKFISLFDLVHIGEPNGVRFV